MVGVDGIFEMDQTMGMKVALESSPWGESQVTGSSLSVSKLWLTLTARELLEVGKVVLPDRFRRGQ